MIENDEYEEKQKEMNLKNEIDKLKERRRLEGSEVQPHKRQRIAEAVVITFQQEKIEETLNVSNDSKLLERLRKLKFRDKLDLDNKWSQVRKKEKL